MVFKVNFARHEICFIYFFSSQIMVGGKLSSKYTEYTDKQQFKALELPFIANLPTHSTNTFLLYILTVYQNSFLSVFQLCF